MFDAIKELTKAELHAHLNGSADVSVVREIAADEDTDIPCDFTVERDLTRTKGCANLVEYLKPWQLLRRIPRRIENLQKLIDSVFNNLKSHSVELVELRSSVLYLTQLQSCSVEEAMVRLLECTQKASLRTSIASGMILTVTRGEYASVHLRMLLSAFDAIGRPPAIVGLDLAGDESVPYPSDLPEIFRRAKAEFGLGITIHAGETGVTQNIRDAVDAFDADRIGHGTAAGSDPGIMEMLAEKDVCVEVCPISNRMTGAVPIGKSHPLGTFERFGVPFVICSDNPGIHTRGLTHDYMVALEEGMSQLSLYRQIEMARKHAFLRVA